METPATAERVITKVESADEVRFQSSLRPQTLTDYIGQATVKANLHIAVQAARQRQESLDHVLLYGSPGLGKTTLAYHRPRNG